MLLLALSVMVESTTGLAASRGYRKEYLCPGAAGRSPNLRCMLPEKAVAGHGESRRQAGGHRRRAGGARGGGGGGARRLDVGPTCPQREAQVGHATGPAPQASGVVTRLGPSEGGFLTPG